MSKTKIEIKEYSEKEFLSLTSEKIEKTVYDTIWKEFEEKLKGKSLNTAYLKEVFTKMANKHNINVPKYIDSIIYGKMQRLIKQKKVEKRYDGKIVVYKFL